MTQIADGVPRHQVMRRSCAARSVRCAGQVNGPIAPKDRRDPSAKEVAVEFIMIPVAAPASRVMRDVGRQIDRIDPKRQGKAQNLLGRVNRILTQRTKDKNKLYALHAPEVQCIAKGKARTPYEFGVKVTVATTLKEGFVVGMRSMPGNPYDGHTLEEAIEQVSILADRKPRIAIVDRGYRGVDVQGVQILRSGQRRGITRTLHKMIKRRSAIEPTIGHMKTDGRLARNPLAGELGDALHAVLCGAGHNIRLLLAKLRLLWACWVHQLIASLRISTPMQTAS